MSYSYVPITIVLTIYDQIVIKWHVFQADGSWLFREPINTPNILYVGLAIFGFGMRGEL